MVTSAVNFGEEATRIHLRIFVFSTSCRPTIRKALPLGSVIASRASTVTPCRLSVSAFTDFSRSA